MGFTIGSFTVGT